MKIRKGYLAIILFLAVAFPSYRVGFIMGSRQTEVKVEHISGYFTEDALHLTIFTNEGEYKKYYPIAPGEDANEVFKEKVRLFLLEEK